MYKHYTKGFEYPADIDLWLRSFENNDIPAAFGNSAEIVGYVVFRDMIVITVRIWEMQK